MSQLSEAGLVRGIRRWDLVAIAVNGIIGAGIFGLPSKVQALIGPYSVLAFLACAAVVTLIILCFAEVASRFAATGGPYLYARQAFGPAVGFEVGWMLWLARLTAFAANSNLLVQYAGYFWPEVVSGWWRVGIITFVMAALAAVNVVGVRNAALVSDLFSIAKLVPLAVFIAVGLFFVNPSSFTTDIQPSYGAFSTSVLMLIYAFTGFEMAVIPAGEAVTPQRNLPMAMLTAIGAVVLVYVLVQIVCVGTLPGLAASERPLADAADQFLGSAGGAFISAGALISIIGNLNVLVLAASRLPFAMAERDELPRSLAATHTRFHTPHAAILLTSAIMLVLALRKSFVDALTISTVARLVAYGATCAAVPVLRRKAGSRAIFRIPAGILVSAATLLLCVWLLSNSSFDEARDAAIVGAVGLLIYSFSVARRRLKLAETVADE